MNETLENNNHPLPDPAWDYYETWEQLLKAKEEIDKALALIKVEEVGNDDCDFHANQHVQDAIAALDSIDFGIDKEDYK
ncbi:hypothetical protein [Iningainema tapete]|uniref:Uncharacterized protein n=1 Tax=Iningainema tapete BLCC-T55 TaxID=2748662 RepID=A0A8J7BY72_9CYAN|nr:hypothetical protein [Iningainema tapete]MBD2775187.1 hypothetical protein [Iningainema tapete BLCC-T55]